MEIRLEVPPARAEKQEQVDCDRSCHKATTNAKTLNHEHRPLTVIFSTEQFPKRQTVGPRPQWAGFRLPFCEQAWPRLKGEASRRFDRVDRAFEPAAGNFFPTKLFGASGLPVGVPIICGEFRAHPHHSPHQSENRFADHPSTVSEPGAVLAACRSACRRRSHSARPL